MKAFKIKCQWCKTEQYVSSEGEGKVYCAYCGQFTKVDKDGEEPYELKHLSDAY